jgi:hypothetical protein
VNRAQKRRAEKLARVKKKDTQLKQLSVRARFESDVRTALLHVGIKLVSMTPGREHEAASGTPTGETHWVMTVHAEGVGFLTVRSSRGTVADVAAGVARVVREKIEELAKPAEPEPVMTGPTKLANPVVIDEPLTLAERIRRAQQATP